MENILIVVGVGILIMILGYQFLKHYNGIDSYFFGPKNRPGETRDYEPFGRTQVLLCLIPGAMLTAIPTLKMVFNIDWNEDSAMVGISLSLIVVFSFNLYEAIARMDTFGRRVGKFFFLTVACGVGVGIGALGSVIVFALVVLYLIFLAFSVALSGGSLKKGDIMLDDGTVVRNKKGLFGEDNYTDVSDSSRTFDRSGDTFTER